MKPNPHREFIQDKLGGTDLASDRLKRSPGAIRMWSYRKAIPRPVWPEILDAYENVSLDDLRALEGRQAA
jgi:hypothetical protein